VTTTAAGVPADPTPRTGPGSVSFAVHAVAFLSGLVGAASAFLVHGSDVQTAVVGGGGVLLSTLSTVSKLLHDRGIHVATIQAAGADIAGVLPQVRKDLAAVQGFVETEWPGVQPYFVDVANKMRELEAKVNAMPGVDALVAAVAAAIRSQPGGSAP
jgi:hypothetical protein